MATPDVYRRLQEHLDEMPVGFPATESGVEIRILEHLFTPEEAELGLHLSALPEPLETIHGRVRKATGKEGDAGSGEGSGVAGSPGVATAGPMEPDELRKRLNRMSSKGVIHKTRRDGMPHYSKLMLAVGMFEFQVNRLTPEFHADMVEYMEGEFGKAFHTTKTSQLRTIPIREEVIPERRVGTYDGARKIVERSEGPFGVLNCVCRQGMDLLNEPCRQTEIRDPHFICCCCGCCCGVPLLRWSK